MTVNLRTTSNTKATNKGSALTHAELDGNFVHFLDTGITVVGDDSSGTEFTPGDDLKIAGGANITTAVSGSTLTITGATPAVTAINNATANELVTIGSTTTELDAESGLTFDGSTLAVTGAITATTNISNDAISIADNVLSASRSNEDLILSTAGTGSINANANVRFNTTYTEDINALSYGAGVNVDCSLAPVHTITLTGNCDFRIDNLGTGQSVTIIITQDGTGSRTATFAETDSTVVKFAGGAPTLTTAASSIDVVTIFNDGTNHLGNIALDLKAS